jgi:hypothetical protein
MLRTHKCGGGPFPIFLLYHPIILVLDFPIDVAYSYFFFVEPSWSGCMNFVCNIGVIWAWSIKDGLSCGQHAWMYF